MGFDFLFRISHLVDLVVFSASNNFWILFHPTNECQLNTIRTGFFLNWMFGETFFTCEILWVARWILHLRISERFCKPIANDIPPAVAVANFLSFQFLLGKTRESSPQDQISSVSSCMISEGENCRVAIAQNHTMVSKVHIYSAGRIHYLHTFT